MRSPKWAGVLSRGSSQRLARSGQGPDRAAVERRLGVCSLRGSNPSIKFTSHVSHFKLTSPAQTYFVSQTPDISLVPIRATYAS